MLEIGGPSCQVFAEHRVVESGVALWGIYDGEEGARVDENVDVVSPHLNLDDWPAYEFDTLFWTARRCRAVIWATMTPGPWCPECGDSIGAPSLIRGRVQVSSIPIGQWSLWPLWPPIFCLILKAFI